MRWSNCPHLLPERAFQLVSLPRGKTSSELGFKQFSLHHTRLTLTSL